MQLSSLAPNPANPRKITDKKLKMLKDSLTEFGDLSGIIFNQTTKRLFGGHQRVKVLPPNAEIEMIDNEHGFVTVEGEKFAYREVEWSEDKEKIALVAANKHGGDWDKKKLTEVMLELDALNVQLSLTGFDDEECAALFDVPDLSDDAGAIEDDKDGTIVFDNLMREVVYKFAHALKSKGLEDVKAIADAEKIILYTLNNMSDTDISVLHSQWIDYVDGV